MSLFKTLFGGRQASSASVAKDRLSLIIARERGAHSTALDFLPQMQQELLAVIAKYIKIDPDAVKVEMEKQGNLDLLEINIVLPDQGQTPTPRR